MKSIVIYDSNYGNTRKIAEVIAAELGSKAVCILDINFSELCNYELLVVGTPINGWKPTENMQTFLSQLEKGQLSGIKATTFDTRVKLFIHGDAMGKLASTLESLGAKIVLNPMPFYVGGKQAEPYLLDGEIEKAKEWARGIKAKL